MHTFINIALHASEKTNWGDPYVWVYLAWNSLFLIFYDKVTHKSHLLSDGVW